MVNSADDVRAECARRRLPLYMLAAKVGLHPVRLGRFLNGHRPLSPELAERIRRALDTDAQERLAAP
jgi:plasmid maintenance system antidote protein VapI